MRLRLQRQPSADGCTLGHLYIDGAWAAYTLEDVVRLGPKIAHETAVPAGIYRVVITRSPRFGRMLPLLVNVPEFDGVRIHAGNTDADTSGCILVGEGVAGDHRLVNSRAALDDVQARIAGAIARGEDVTIEIRNADTMMTLSA